MKTSRLFYHFYVSHPLTSIAPYFSSTDRRAVFLLVRKQKTNQLDSHQRIQLTEITTSSLRSGSPVRQQLNFTLLMEETSCSLALSSEFVGNHKKELANNGTFFGVCFIAFINQCFNVVDSQYVIIFTAHQTSVQTYVDSVHLSGEGIICYASTLTTI